MYNKFNGYDLTTKIIDNSSGKLYAQISSHAKMIYKRLSITVVYDKRLRGMKVMMQAC